jgi:hypothetical protein
MVPKLCLAEFCEGTSKEKEVRENISEIGSRPPALLPPSCLPITVIILFFLQSRLLDIFHFLKNSFCTKNVKNH